LIADAQEGTAIVARRVEQGGLLSLAPVIIAGSVPTTEGQRNALGTFVNHFENAMLGRLSAPPPMPTPPAESNPQDKKPPTQQGPKR
jgi:hypothetical protein